MTKKADVSTSIKPKIPKKTKIRLPFGSVTVDSETVRSASIPEAGGDKVIKQLEKTAKKDVFPLPNVEEDE